MQGKRKRKEDWTESINKTKKSLQQILVLCGSMLHTQPTNHHLLAAKQEPYQKAQLFTKNIEDFLEENKSQENRPAGRKQEDRKRNGSRQKNKRGVSKVESNDSPKIPDRGETSKIPGLPFGEEKRTEVETEKGDREGEKWRD